MPFAVPKHEPECVYLQEAAAHVIEREPSLDIGQVRKALSDAIAYGRLRIQSDDDPNDALTWTAFRARQRGFIDSTFAETWRKWLENGAEIGWSVGRIFVSNGDNIVPIRLPRVRLAEVFSLFEVAEDKPAVEEVPVEEVEPKISAEGARELSLVQDASAQDEPTAKKRKVPTAELEAWYPDRVKKWPAEKKPPNVDDDWTAAIAHFYELNVTREQIRSVRKNFAPQSWKAHGRRPDFQDPNKLAKKLTIKLADKPADK